MGQQEVYAFLKKRKGKWFTTREMHAYPEFKDQAIGCIGMSAKRLKKVKGFKYRPRENVRYAATEYSVS